MSCFKDLVPMEAHRKPSRNSLITPIVDRVVTALLRSIHHGELQGVDLPVAAGDGLAIIHIWITTRKPCRACSSRAVQEGDDLSLHDINRSRDEDYHPDGHSDGHPDGYPNDELNTIRYQDHYGY